MSSEKEEVPRRGKLGAVRGGQGKRATGTVTSEQRDVKEARSEPDGISGGEQSRRKDSLWKGWG